MRMPVLPALAGLMATALLAACGGSSSPGAAGGSTPAPVSSRTLLIQPGPDATSDALEAFIGALPGDVIEFDCGYFDIQSTLLLSNTENITIRGCGIDETVVSFRNSNGVEGFLMDNVRGVVIEDLTLADPDGNAFELRSVDHGTLRRVRSYWSSGGGRESPDPITAENFDDGRLHIPCTDPAFQNPDVPENEGGDTTSPDYTVSDRAGRYGIYPVASRNILVDEAESIGASDAGIYVGQTTNAIIRNSRAAYNVFGFEIENVQNGEYFNNLAECNTGGFLVYDLDNLTQYGSRTRVYNNISRNNNTYNFTEGGIVGQIPPGTGMLTLSYDRIDVFDNVFENNNTGGFIHVSYELLPEGGGRPTENKIDWYSEGVRIFRNTFTNNGNMLPNATTQDLAEQNVAKVLPALIGYKNQAACQQDTEGRCPDGDGYRGGHIIWDGLLPEYNEDCPYPVDENGDPVPADENGKPQHTSSDPNPDCHYNAYKFDTTQPDNPRIVPLWFASCIDADNTFSDDSLTYANFNGTKGANAVIALSSGGVPTAEQLAEVEDFPSDLDWTPHMCVDQYGENLEPLPPVVIPPFVPSGDLDPAPSPEEVARLCNATVGEGEVNFGAAMVDCPRLDQYNLFADPEDPTSTPNSDGYPFVLNTKLFSDYSVKYRVAYLPPGMQIVYREGAVTSPNAHLVYPVGTIIAKTFSFHDNGDEEAIETRLIIKRRNSMGQARWVGLPYIWKTATDGSRFAELQLAGATAEVSWDYTDADSGVRHTGSTDVYSIPNANQCKSCHTNEDVDPGTAPIGPKVRNLNRPYASESPAVTGQSQHEIAGRNQIEYLCSTGRMTGCPSDLGVNATTQIAENLPRSPKFNVPGDAGFAAGSDEDIEARTRAWLEVNCQHCHNSRGFAANTGFYLDVFRRVDASYGICKGPTATGADGSGGRAVDIHPGDASRSILEFRISEAAESPAAKMPPIARSVVDIEGHALVEQWINDVVVADESRYPGSTSCAGDGGGGGELPGGGGGLPIGGLP